MGIPTVNGAIYFDRRYLGNPLVYCGNIGLIPRDKSRKEPKPGDLIVAVGGRTGRDGIHGATFSSAELTSESETVSGGAVPPYRNPALDEPYGPEQRKIAGGGQSRGVMEKCTFCVHRVEDGLDPACVQTCPVRALTFGDLDDPTSAVSRAIAGREGFRLLEEAGTEPRVHYVGGAAPGPEAREVDEPVTEV